MGTKCPSEAAPWCLFGFFLGIQKETRRRGGETPQQKSRNIRQLQILIPVVGDVVLPAL